MAQDNLVSMTRSLVAHGVAGTMDTRRTTVAGPVPALIIHGTADSMVPYAGGQGDTSLTRTDFAVFDDMVVLIWKLNATRDVEGWELVVGKKNAQPFIDMFNTLHIASTPC